MLTKAYVEPQMRARISLYLAGLIASAMGLTALHSVLTGGSFSSFAFALIAIGYCISWTVRAKLVSGSTLATITLIILASTLSLLLIEPQFRYQLVPLQALDEPDLLAAIVLASLMVVYSFKLATDMSVLFMLVPSLSLIGLLATADPSAEMLTYFGIFLACSSFALIRQNALASETAAPMPSGSLKRQISITVGVTLTALMMGSLVGTMFYPMIVRVVMARMSDMASNQGDQTTEEFVPVATGPVALSDQELLTVKCERPLLWRERTYNHYTGQGWSSELASQERRRAYPTTSDASGRRAFRISDPLSPEPRRAVEPVMQTFRITSGVYRSLFAAAEPVTIPYNGWPPVVIIAAGLEAGDQYTRGWSYQVVSNVSVASPRDLRTASTDYPEVIRSRYLGTPQSCWQVQKLTNRVTEAATTPIQKAENIERFLSTNFTYDTNAPAAPSDKDAVTYFLFESKRGYCDIFASAMVIMSRQAGIPARWATGFAPGEYNSSDGAYHVKVRDRHAWAELYFPRYGWIPFDVVAEQQDAGWLASLEGSWRLLMSEKATVYTTLLLLLCVGYLVKAEVIDRIRRRKRMPAWSPASTEIGACYQRMCRILARYGLPRCPSMTPLEYAAQTNDLVRLDEISVAVDFLTADFVEFRYSNREPPPDKIETMTNTLQALVRGLRNAKRGKLLPKK